MQRPYWTHPEGPDSFGECPSQVTNVSVKAATPSALIPSSVSYSSCRICPDGRQRGILLMSQIPLLQQCMRRLQTPYPAVTTALVQSEPNASFTTVHGPTPSPTALPPLVFTTITPRVLKNTNIPRSKCTTRVTALCEMRCNLRRASEFKRWQCMSESSQLKI